MLFTNHKITLMIKIHSFIVQYFATQNTDNVVENLSTKLRTSYNMCGNYKHDTRKNTLDKNSEWRWRRAPSQLAYQITLLSFGAARKLLTSLLYRKKHES